MNFVYPYFLFALAALAIPVIIHLFNFRRYKKIYFTNVRFLKEVKEETTHRSKLKHLLVLLCRILAISFLVFAFAQPYIPKSETRLSKGSKAVSIYIDNSFSMNAVTEELLLFDKAKQQAREIAAAYRSEDRFQLLTNDFEGKHQRLVSKEEFLDFTDEVKISPAVKNISEVMMRQKQLLANENNPNKIAFLVSDFQKNSCDVEKVEKDTTVQVHFIPLKSASQNNVFIDSCWFESPVRMLHSGNKLVVRLKNTGSDEVENSRLTLKINEQIKAITDFNIAAKSAIADTLNFNITQTGWHQAAISLTDYPITFDDNYFFTFYVPQNISVLAIHEEKESQYINAVFASSPAPRQRRGEEEERGLFSLQNSFLSRLDYSSLKNFRFIILNNLKNISSGLTFELKQFLEEGGSVLIFPNAMMDINSYRSFLQSVNANSFAGLESKEREVAKINTEEWIFKDVFENLSQNLSLPKAKGSFVFTRMSRAKEEPLLRFKDGSSFVSKYPAGKGKLYLCAAPLDVSYSDFPVHSLFAPMLFRMAVASGKVYPLAYELSKDNVIEAESRAGSGEKVFKMKANEKEFIPEQRSAGSKISLLMHGGISTAGIYTLEYPNHTDSVLLAFNFDRRESDLNYFSADELNEKIAGKNIRLIEQADANLAAVIKELNEGITLWKLCIILTLLFLAAEILLLRFWK